MKANCLLVVTAEVDPAVEDAWNDWYNCVHLPEALACPGVLAGRRYVSAGRTAEFVRGERRSSEKRVYMTIYELSGPEAVETPEFAAMRGWYEFGPNVVSQTRVVVAL